MKQFVSKIIKNSVINESFLEMEFEWNSTQRPSPGQFLTIRVSDKTVPLLRRPFAFSSFDNQNKSCSIIYQKRGEATEALSQKRTGEKIDIIGPIGNGFPIFEGKEALLVAGGIGLGPILFLSNSLRKAGISTTLVFGCRSKNLKPVFPSFERENPVICTDDGSEGFHGTAMDYLNSISQKAGPGSALFCCGPHPMLRACHNFSTKHQIPCYVSVEQVMACGVGACMGCVVKTVDPLGFKRACKEGPVFRSFELEW